VPAERKQRKKAIAIALAFAAVAGLVAASLGDRWLTTNSGDEGLGLLDVEICLDGCKKLGNDELVVKIDRDIEETKALNKTRPPNQQVELPRPAWHGWPVVGLITFFASLVAAAGLVVAALLALGGKRPEVAIMPTTVAVLGLLIAIVTGCIFVATKPIEMPSMVVGWTFMTFGGGIVVGLAAVFPLNRQIRPIDEELGEGSATMSWGASRDDAP
jgi:MFS family permease